MDCCILLPKEKSSFFFSFLCACVGGEGEDNPTYHMPRVLNGKTCSALHLEDVVTNIVRELHTSFHLILVGASYFKNLMASNSEDQGVNIIWGITFLWWTSVY